jgi:hypothetical protein
MYSRTFSGNALISYGKGYQAALRLAPVCSVASAPEATNRTFGLCQALPLAVVFPRTTAGYRPDMGSYPRREKAEREARARADTVPALDCQSCGALTPGERFRYYADQVVCEGCDERNPQSRRRLVPQALLQPRNILVNFVEGRSLAAQAMALDHRTMLGPQLRIKSAATLRRLLAYLGATPEQLAEFDDSHRRWGQGTVQITLQPGRKNLLRLRDW